LEQYKLNEPGAAGNREHIYESHSNVSALATASGAASEGCSPGREARSEGKSGPAAGDVSFVPDRMGGTGG
jgi:hypothetical protein